MYSDGQCRSLALAFSRHRPGGQDLSVSGLGRGGLRKILVGERGSETAKGRRPTKNVWLSRLPLWATGAQPERHPGARVQLLLEFSPAGDGNEEAGEVRTQASPLVLPARAVQQDCQRTPPGERCSRKPWG